MHDEHETGFDVTNKNIAKGRYNEVVSVDDKRICPSCRGESIIICPNDYQRFEYCDACGLLEERDPCEVPTGGGWLVWSICWTKNLLMRISNMFR